MMDNDKARFTAIMAGMADNFRDTITREGLKLRFNVLKMFSVEQIEQAAFKIMATRKYTKMPTVAEFIEAIKGGGVEDVAEVQAGVVIGQIRAVGAYGSPEFDDPITQGLFISRFNWGDLCRMTDRELTWFIRDFKAAYLAYDKAHGLIFIDGSKELKQLAAGIGETF